MKKLYFACIGLHILYSCGTTATISADSKTEHETETIDLNDTQIGSKQTIDLNYMDLNVRPQDDFFKFSNGTWVKNNPVPASESRWGSFNELDVSNKKKLTAILEEATTLNAEEGTIMQVLGDFYSSYLDMNTRDRTGITSIQDELGDIQKIQSKNELPSIIAKHHESGIGSLFRFGVRQNLKDVENHIAAFGQGGIGLPNKDYYSDVNKKDILNSYADHIVSIGILLGYTKSDANKFSASVLSIEKMLSESMMSRAELRIPERTYNKESLNDFKKSIAPFDFESYLLESKIESFDTLIVGQPAFAIKISEIIQSVALEDWKQYLTWKVINHYANHLDTAFIAQNFSFYGKVLSGKTEMKPINQRAIDEITHLPIGELLGKAFVGRHYSDVSQQRVNTMVDNLVLVFRERIKLLEWMTDDTKAQALVKLNAIGRKLGFPNKWEDFSSLDFSKNEYIENVRKMAQYSRRNNISELNEPVDKDEWGMPAHMINAYYHPLLNEIAFPAGIMQAPFFSDKYEDAVNYGRIGMVIGHEFTHGFDDMGSKFAADGTFRNWWTEEDRNAFESRTEKLGATYSHFCPIENQCVKPDLTMGENIADLGGLTLAYHAYTRTDEFQSGILKQGYTPAQRFFISYAQLWKINYTNEELKNRLENDSHSPGMYRVNGPLMNCPEFFKAFTVQESDSMRNTSETISKIW